MIPVFQLVDGQSTYKIINLQVSVCAHPVIGCDFVFSDTMFSKADTFIQRRKEKAIDIIFDKSKYICTPKYAGSRFTVTTWAQNGEV